MISKSHYLFLLDFNPWPLLSSFCSFNMMISLLFFLKNSLYNLFLFNIFLLSLSSFFWWLSYSGEFNLEGKSSFNLDRGLKYSMLLFISSEIFFFFSFFWSYFHFYLAPVMEDGLIWPPFFVEPFSCLNVPLVNTLILLSSGITVTLSHYYLNKGMKINSSFFLFFTIMLGFIFTIFQLMEYFSSFFCISDCNFGSTFFMLTGFHGIHVIVGSVFLMVVLIRFMKIVSSENWCLSFELSSWYWHFVDVVWIFLYFIIYYLNN